jgi:hypothetical protein
MHFYLTTVFYLFHRVDLGNVSMLLIQLEDQIFHQHKLINSNIAKEFYGEELIEESLEFLQFVIFSDSLLTAYKLVYPLVVLLPLGVLLLELVPNTLQGGNIDLHFIA